MPVELQRPRVVIGKVSAVFGVRGQVKVYSYTEPRENILNYDPWLLGCGEKWYSCHLESGQRHGKSILARLKGYENRDQALGLVGQEIAIYRDQLPEIDQNEYYWSDLEGLTAVNRQGQVLGTVSHLFETGSNDVLVVKGERERLIPYIPGQVVLDIDLEGRKMVVDWDPEF